MLKLVLCFAIFCTLMAWACIIVGSRSEGGK